MLQKIWNSIKDSIRNRVKWISDRIYTLSGVLTISLAGILFVKKEWYGGLGIPDEFGNVFVNAVLLIGVTLFRFGQKNDEYKKISEI